MTLDVFNRFNTGLLPESYNRGEIWVRLTPAYLRAAQALGGSTLGGVQGEPGADFTLLGTFNAPSHYERKVTSKADFYWTGGR